MAASSFASHGDGAEINKCTLSHMPNQDDKRIALVTGSSSGTRFETSLALARNGFYTYATIRNPAKGKVLVDVAEKERYHSKL